MPDSDNEDVYPDTKPSKFRLKSKPGSRKRRHNSDIEDERDGRFRRRHRSRDRHSSRRSHKHSRREREHRSGRTVYDRTFERNGVYEDPDYRHRESLYDNVGNSNPGYSGDGPIDSDQAFRESLFDALADDEGAAYWEGVYGQPIHVYSDARQGPDGELERMNDEEYADHVRTKMWEKTHQHIIEERAARERERSKQKERRRQLEEEAEQEEAEREKVRRQMKESLKRGEERKRAREAEAAWGTYTKKWDHLKSNPDVEALLKDTKLNDLIPWPVVSGRLKHVSKDEVEYFFEKSPAWNEDAAALLKIERVRWHPDKMQQRFGQHIDQELMKPVTAVFQVIDHLWNQRRR
ncbi:hypothetical protein BU24DRAFT_402913 [Aaosphaeria arxii CBS 175.79]|uniref:Uncharacterized protein n=1 Tax=Aaosphaeria arxii CBS 175.79 TaxID=1450172 RepID=A0A6A5X6V9_9PLEO|nr:uncharacterized protein BU24DRAFT_402913 [Aaosphaeria arxii CBS 175.79]KAF2008669.1 hypothetical protein BU24DRAFT_402913 [Aaosphaeria arxii CBS 175.79]